MGAIFAFRFDEPIGVQLSDGIGNAGDLRTGAGLSDPDIVDAWSGSGRRFTGSGLVSHADRSALGTLAQRDCTLQAIVAIHDFALLPQTIVARGTNDGPIGDLVCYGLELVAGASPSRLGVRWFWQDSAGVYRHQTAGEFDAPEAGEFILITATRRWETSTRVVLRYYVADELIAEVVSSDGDIAGGTSGLLTIGARRSAGSWSRFLAGTIDELIGYDHEAPAAEVRHTWLTLDRYLEDGRIQVAAAMPPGMDLDAPNKATHKWITIAGQAMGLLHAYIEGLRSRYFAGDCDEDQMTEWEFEYGILARPGDSLDIRAQRVNAVTAEPKGNALPTLQQIFAAPFDLPASDVDIVEMQNETIETWGAINPMIWQEHNGTWSVSGGELAASVGAGIDHRWSSKSIAMLRSPLVGNSININATMVIKSATLAIGSFVGMALVELVNWQGVAFGVRRDAAYGYRATVLHMNGPVITVEDIGPAGAECHVRIRQPLPAAVLPHSPIEFGYCDTAIAAAANAYITRNVTAIDYPTSIGIMINAEAVSATVDQAVIGSMSWLDRNGPDIFRWYAYRDPGLPGTPDMEGAERLARRLSPSFGSGHAVSSLSFSAGEPGTGRVPMGAIRRR